MNVNKVYAIFCLLIFFGFGHTQQAKNVTVSWDANSESDLAGYKVYIGESSGNYSGNVDVGNVLQFTWNNLAVGKIYFFAVTAYDAAGNESDFSEEVSIALDPPVDTNPPAPPRNVNVRIEGSTAIIEFEHE